MVAALALLLIAPPSVSPDADEVLERLQARYDSIEDLRAEFVQIQHSGGLGAAPPESGKLVVEKPGRMRWDYREPEAKIAVLDQPWSWVWFREEGEVMCQRLEGLLEDAPVAALLVGDVRLADQFRVELLPPESDGEHTILLRPRTLSEQFDEVILSVDADGYLIRHLEVVDPVGNRMEYRFREVRVNQGVRRGTFAPRIPKNVAWSGECPPDRRDGP